MPLGGTREKSARLVDQPHPISGHWYISSPAPQVIRVEEPTACSPMYTWQIGLVRGPSVYLASILK